MGGGESGPKDIVGVQFHVYKGKVRNFEGPSIHNICLHLHMLEPYMLGGSVLRSYDSIRAVF